MFPSGVDYIITLREQGRGASRNVARFVQHRSTPFRDSLYAFRIKYSAWFGITISGFPEFTSFFQPELLREAALLHSETLYH
jgi:hypothetical protein